MQFESAPHSLHNRNSPQRSLNNPHPSYKPHPAQVKVKITKTRTKPVFTLYGQGDVTIADPFGQLNNDQRTTNRNKQRPKRTNAINLQKLTSLTLPLCRKKLWETFKIRI